MENREYYIGLDMGTNSIGWAVTDTSYHLLRLKGKDAWGIREFEEAETSAERRSHRVSRRALQREKERLGQLRFYFDESVRAVDPNFFTRLENSKYYLEDKEESVRTPNGIFNDKGYKDKDYYAQYPTIFHLRKELIQNQAPHDVRLVYLAVANLFRHRGHFLNAGLGSEDNGCSIQEAYDLFCSCADEMAEVSFPGINAEEIQDILSNRNMNRTKKAEAIAALLSIEKKDKRRMAYIKTICGLKVDTAVLFNDIESEQKQTIEFSSAGYEEKIPDILSAVGEDCFQVVEAMKQIYDIGSLAGILKGSEYLSFARVEEYEKHRKDLAVLKKIVKEKLSEKEYDFLFRSEEDGSYSAYVNSVNSGRKKQRRDMKKRTRDDFYATVKKLLKAVSGEDAAVKYILEEIDKETFMPKQLTSANGVIPNQVHLKELKRILKNAAEYLPFLNETGESGQSIAEEILQLFSFQIPYYVGPVSDDSAKNGGNGWVVRKEPGRVFPWNMEQKIDLKKTSEEFILRMVRKCTYLSGENVLPYSSLRYERFRVLNEINNIKINGTRLPVETKQDLYRDLFEQKGRVTKKQIITYLKNKGILTQEEEMSGIDIAVNNALSSYIKFREILGAEIDTDRGREKAEEIIFFSTVYGESRKMLKAQLKEKFPELSDDAIRRISGLKCKDWGNLSGKFLELNGCNPETGEVMSLLRALWETNYNMMELLNKEEFGFRQSLESMAEVSVKSLTEFTAEDLEGYYFSAPVRRMIWQTLLIIKEVIAITGSEPKKIFLEMTRNDQEKGDAGRTNSRKKQFLELYKNVKDDLQNWEELIEAEDASGRLKSKKMYLYLTQMGRDMYTGKPISLDQLFDDNIYDIDHIYPRHFVKDDNINNNLVLVYKPLNSNKSDEYPLNPEIRKNQEVKVLWQTLLGKGLITEEKYRRLTGTEPFTEEQKAGFIARQLVETSQGTKAVADLMKQLVPGSRIVYSKASNVTEFRHDMKLVKSRSINEFHHANDAYLNIVVGNVYDVKFTQNPLNYIRKEYSRDQSEYNLSRMFDRDVKRGSETAWIASRKGTSGTMDTVRRVMEKNSPLLTRKAFEAHGAIANATIYSHKTAKDIGYIPVKSSDHKVLDVMKYGGYTSVSTAYFFLVEHEIKGKKVRTIETVPVYLREKLQDKVALLKYCVNELNLKNPTVRQSKINIQSLMKIDGFYVYISSKTENRIGLRSAVELCIPGKWTGYIHGLEKSLPEMVNRQMVTKEENLQLYDLLTEKHLHGIFSRRPNPVGETIRNGREKFESLPVEKQVEVLKQIISLSAVGIPGADLTMIGGAAKSGTMKISKEITKLKECKLISTSVTGLYSSEINLLTV